VVAVVEEPDEEADGEREHRDAAPDADGSLPLLAHLLALQLFQPDLPVGFLALSLLGTHGPVSLGDHVAPRPVGPPGYPRPTWRSSCRSTAARPSPTPTACAPSPSTSPSRSARATTWSSWSPPWGRRRTTSSPWPTPSRRPSPAGRWTC